MARGDVQRPPTRAKRRTLLALCASLAWTAAASTQPQPCDTEKSFITVRVYKAGFLSALGHDHEITAPIARGTLDIGARQVEVYANASALQVLDPRVSREDRAKIRSTMLGPDVLDAERHPEVVFRSTTAEPMGPGSWRINGNLEFDVQLAR